MNGANFKNLKQFQATTDAVDSQSFSCEDLILLYNFCISNKSKSVSVKLELIKGRFIATYSGINILPHYLSNKKELFAATEWFNFLSHKVKNFGFQNLCTTQHKKVIKGRREYVPKKTYLMRESTTGFIKIGKSNKPAIREKTLQHEKPTISLLAECDSDIERELHKNYKNNRVRGEWFNITEDETLMIINKYGFKPVPLR